MRKILPGFEGLRDSLWSNFISWLAGGAALASLAAAGAFWQRLTPFLQWACISLSGLLAWTALGLWILRRLGMLHGDVAEIAGDPDATALARQIEDLRSEFHSALPVSPLNVQAHAPEALGPPLEMASEESLERLRQLHQPCRRALQWAIEMIQSHLQGAVIESQDERDKLILRLIGDFPLQAARDRLSSLCAMDSVKNVRTISEKHFAELVQLFASVLAQYEGLCQWYLWAGRLVMGPASVSGADFEEFRARHALLIDRISALEGRRDTAEIENVANGRDLRHLLPPPNAVVASQEDLEAGRLGDAEQVLRDPREL